MTFNKTTRQNRLREALGKIYDQQPPFFREYLRRFQEDPTSRVFAPLAEAYRRLGRIEEAIEICKEGLEHHPDFYSGRVALAKCLIEKKEFQLGAQELQKVVKAVPENLLAQRLLGETFLVMGNMTDALHCFKMALLLSPADVFLSEKVHSLEQEILCGQSPIETGENVDSKNGNEEEPSGSLEPSQPESTFLEGGAEDFTPFWKSDSLEPMYPTSGSDGVLEPGVLETETHPEEKGLNTGEKPSFIEDPKPEEEMLDSLDDIKVSVGLPKIEGGEAGGLDDILGAEEDESTEDAFSVTHVSSIFNEGSLEKGKEITTETLGDLYYSQGQYDQALRIFEKLEMAAMSPELARKIHICRTKLGVDRRALIRKRKIEVLRKILTKVKEGEIVPGKDLT